MFDRSSSGDCNDEVRVVKGELVLDEEGVVVAVEAMETGSDTIKENMKAWKKAKA